MRFKLLRYYSIASAVAVVVVTAILAVVYGRYATDSLVTSVEQQNVILASFIANDLSARAPQHFKANIPDAENLATARHVQHIKDIDAILKDLLKSLPVLKVKAYRDDLTIYSTEHSQIGEIQSSPGFLIARNQGIPASKLSFRGEFNAFEGVISNRNIVETYVPVGGPETMTGESSRLIIEIYTDVTPLVAKIEQTKVNLIAGLIFLFAALYGVLVLIVGRADRVIDRQYEDLNGEITERKKAEQVTRRLAAAIEELSENFALFGPDDRLVMCNKGYREINEAIVETTTPGTLFEDHLRVMVEKGLAPEAVGREEEWLRERMERHRNPKGPFELRRQDGIWLLIHDQRMPDGSTATISTDITERKQAEEILHETEAIRRSEERLRTIFETSPVGIAIVSVENNKRLYINPAMVKLFGAESVEQLLEHDLETTYADPEDLKRLRARTGDDFITEIEVERKRLDGSRWWCLLNRRLIDYEGQNALMGWHYDITERKQAELKIKTLNEGLEILIKKRTKELEKSEAKHRHFSADVAHELRTPLAVLRSHLDNLENTETIRSLSKDVDAMSRLVSQLLATTQLDSLTVNPSDEADLHAIGTEVVKYLAPLAVKEGRSIEMTGTQDPVIVRGNNDALEMAVRNLVENALRYSARETVVTIHVSDEPAISVINHGLSISPEQQKVIFQRFKRADQRSGGAGLGLSIVQRVVETHQATIDVTDAPGGGAVFKIGFPSPKSLKVVAS